MSRVLITGGAGMIGAAVARRLLADPAYDVRIADERNAPQWMREACEIRSADLRAPAQAQAAVKGCSQVIHVASFRAQDADLAAQAHTRIEYENALHNAVIRAALDRQVERFVYVSSPLVFERAELFPTPEEYLPRCPVALSPSGFSRLTGERYCRAAHTEHDFPFTICRPFATYGPGPAAAGEPGVSRAVAELIDGALAGGRPLEVSAAVEQTITPTHVGDVAEGIVAALGSPAALNEDFNLAGSLELSVAEIAQIVWRACGQDDGELTLEQLGGGAREPTRSLPAADKAGELLGWQARTAFEDGVAAMVRSLRGPAIAEGHIGRAL
jgi:nucleoside-diphosphate-sugar epimerase